MATLSANRQEDDGTELLRRGWAAPLVHPLPLAAVLLLAINDHWLKGAELLPQALTGKLSDFAGLFYFPLLLVALVRGGAALLGRAQPRASGWAALIAIAATGLVFAAAKLSLAVNGFLSTHWGHMERDASDLAALIMLAPAWLWLRRFDDAAT